MSRGGRNATIHQRRRLICFRDLAVWLSCDAGGRGPDTVLPIPELGRLRLLLCGFGTLNLHARHAVLCATENFDREGWWHEALRSPGCAGRVCTLEVRILDQALVWCQRGGRGHRAWSIC